MSTEPVETLVERVREWVANEVTLAEYNDAPGWREDKEVALAALTELAERLAESEQRVRELEADPDRPTVTYAGDELETCEERLEAAERETTAARIDRAGYLNAKVDAEELAEAAEARVAALEEALREIGQTYDGVTPIFRKTGTKLLGADAFEYAPDISEALNMARRWPARAALRVEGDAANPATERRFFTQHTPGSEPGEYGWRDVPSRVEGDEG